MSSDPNSKSSHCRLAARWLHAVVAVCLASLLQTTACVERKRTRPLPENAQIFDGGDSPRWTDLERTSRGISASGNETSTSEFAFVSIDAAASVARENSGASASTGVTPTAYDAIAPPSSTELPSDGETPETRPLDAGSGHSSPLTATGDSSTPELENSTFPSCEPHAALRCAPDGNVHWFNSCGAEEDLTNQCPGDCIDETKSARCRCIVYLNRGDTDAPIDGRAWNSGYRNLPDALSAADERGGCELWAAAGTYGIDGTPMREGVDMYAGFTTDMSRRVERDPAAHPTVLDATGAVNEGGALLGADGALLDGFTLSGARLGALVNDGTSPIVRNCVFTNNRVTDRNGALVNTNGASPTIEDTTFISNSGLYAGNGMIHNEESSPLFRRCLVKDNSYPITERNSHSRYEDSEFSANINRLAFDNSVIVRSRFVGNRYSDGAPISGKKVYIVSSIFGDNRSSSYRETGTESLDVSGTVVNSLFVNHRFDTPIVQLSGEGSMFVNNAFAGNVLGDGPGGIGDAAAIRGVDGAIVGNTIFSEAGITSLHSTSVATVGFSLLREGSCSGCQIGDPFFATLEGSAFLRPSNPAALDSGSRLLLPPDLADLDEDGDVEEPLPVDAVGAPRLLGDEVDMGPVEVR